MNGCMVSHATQAEQDAAREEWFAKRLERQREREKKAMRAEAQEDFAREWWGIGEADPEKRRKKDEMMRRAERVGGFAGRNRVRLEQEVVGKDTGRKTGKEEKR
jgi:COX assembly mitochondrial protein 1